MKNQNNRPKHTMDIVLTVIAVVLIIFTIAMVITYWYKGGVPDILVTSVFTACLGEFGFMAWIKIIKQKTGGNYDEDHDCTADHLGNLYDPVDGSDQENDWK